MTECTNNYWIFGTNIFFSISIAITVLPLSIHLPHYKKGNMPKVQWEFSIALRKNIIYKSIRVYFSLSSFISYHLSPSPDLPHSFSTFSAKLNCVPQTSHMLSRLQVLSYSIPSVWNIYLIYSMPPIT